MTTTALQRKIMRRVYYAYTIAIATHTMFWQGLLLGASVALFGRLTHVARLFDSVVSVPVGSLPAYVGGAFGTALQNGEVLTVLVTAFMLMLAVSVAIRMMPMLTLLRRRAV